MTLTSFFNDNKPAIVFIIKFVAFYLVFNSLYGLFVDRFLPQPDPITILVSNNVAWCHQWLGENTHALQMLGSKNVALCNAQGTVVQVYEGCNSVNVMLVFWAFLFAFTGPRYATLLFAIAGGVSIYMINLVRVSALYFVELNWPRYVYFFHKYLFTGVIYAVVFLLWFLWIRWLKRGN